MVQVYVIFSLAPVMAMNSGGLRNLAANLGLAIILLLALLRLARPALSCLDGQRILIFGRRGFAGLCIYLVLLYGVAYVVLRPDGLPSVPVQLFTFVFYGLAIGGLWLHSKREPQAAPDAPVERRELHLVTILFVTLLVIALLLSGVAHNSLLYPPVILNFVFWTPLGFVLTALSLTKGLRESCGVAKTRHKITVDEDTSE
jgi:phosphatidylserine synthase